MFQKLTIICLIILSVSLVSAQKESAYEKAGFDEIAKTKSAILSKKHFFQEYDREEYAIYQVLLKEFTNSKEYKRVIVEKLTNARFFDNEPLNIKDYIDGQEEKSIDQSIVENFNKKNYKTQSELQTKFFPKNDKILLVSDSDINKNFEESCEDGWKKFYEKYPYSQGITTLSKVGFNKEKTKALVYIGTLGACLAGAGYLVALQKRAKNWRIIAKYSLWVS